MPALNLKTIDPAELMPVPEVPESYGPRNDEDREVQALIQEALDSGPAQSYETVADFMEALRTRASTNRS